MISDVESRLKGIVLVESKMSQDDSFEQSLDSIHRKLLSSKATLRKVFPAAVSSFVVTKRQLIRGNWPLVLQEGLKVLNLLLDNNDFHLVLDQNTFVTGPSAKLKGTTQT